MGGNIHLTIGGDAQKAKNANCESQVKPVHYIFYAGMIDLPETQLLAGISLVERGTKCRQ